ncbi:hypothetical protein SCHPADRAFT_895575 [Schizopora paradoxa]|uniref:Ubiquitin-like protease family profile domain-containing protein n=1 Tax=Schizopora paradoxa TaxID=27342 RepID=A0A0H2R3D4_9AGAM|nr:hypothetical protein SCHPADRAFT_895575 [Schizopora paradoxa]
MNEALADWDEFFATLPLLRGTDFDWMSYKPQEPAKYWNYVRKAGKDAFAMIVLVYYLVSNGADGSTEFEEKLEVIEFAIEHTRGMYERCNPPRLSAEAPGVLRHAQVERTTHTVDKQGGDGVRQANAKRGSDSRHLSWIGCSTFSEATELAAPLPLQQSEQYVTDDASFRTSMFKTRQEMKNNLYNQLTSEISLDHRRLVETILNSAEDSELSERERKYLELLSLRGVTLSSARSLLPDRWVVDGVINPFGSLISVLAARTIVILNSFFAQKLSKYGYEGVSRWSRKEIATAGGFVPGSALKLVMPISEPIERTERNKGMHWTLGVIDCKERRVEYWNSLNAVGDASAFFKVAFNYCNEHD